jgi:hypothetical protein
VLPFSTVGNSNALAAAAAAAATPQQSAGLLATIGRAVASTAAAAAAAAASPATPAPVVRSARSRRQSPANPVTSSAAGVTGTAPNSSSRSGSSNDDDTVVVHIHFGMSGAFRTSLLPGPEATPTTRLRLVHESSQLVAHLSAMTVQHGGLGLYQEKVCA